LLDFHIEGIAGMNSSHHRRRVRLAALSITLTVAIATAACSSDEDAATNTNSATPSTASSQESTEIADIVRRQVADLGLSAAVFGVWRGDDEVALGAVGESPVGVPATTDMQLRVGQPMEPMLSTVLLQLDEEGTLPLDQPIAKWEPNFPRAETITPRMLANSTSGISDYVTDPQFLKLFTDNPMKGWTSQEILNLANSRPPLFEPGTSWAYAHSDLTLLGDVMEKATGKPLGDLLQQRVFDPLGMDNSSVVLTPQMDEPILHGYTNERGVFEDSTFWNPTAFLHSGNMNAPVADVGRWVRALGTGELLSDKAFEQQMAPTTAGLGSMTADKFFSFGTGHLDGWLVMNPSYGGYNGLALYYPDSKTTIVVYATLGPTTNANLNNAVSMGKEIGTLLEPDHPPQVPTP
jgi:D-alanyl-D-alanine carboxypeptidase